MNTLSEWYYCTLCMGTTWKNVQGHCGRHFGRSCIASSSRVAHTELSLYFYHCHAGHAEGERNTVFACCYTNFLLGAVNNKTQGPTVCFYPCFFTFYELFLIFTVFVKLRYLWGGARHAHLGSQFGVQGIIRWTERCTSSKCYGGMFL